MFRSFTDRARTVRHRIDVVEQGKRVLMTILVFETNEQTYYLCDAAGNLQIATGGTSIRDAHMVPLDQARRGFNAEKAFWHKTLTP